VNHEQDRQLFAVNSTAQVRSLRALTGYAAILCSGLGECCSYVKVGSFRVCWRRRERVVV
jgi:hypothetical protein